jgi:arginine transport system permease protein
MITAMIQYFPAMLSGLWVTLQLMVCALAIGFFLAIILTLCSATERFYLKAPINVFVFFIRGTPLLVQIFIIYYGSGQFPWLRDSIFWDVLKHPFGCAALALALNTAAYSTALFVGVIRAIPRGEVEACEVLGFSRGQMMRRIIFPRAWRIALPAYSNEVVMVLKSTSLASTITLLDIMGVTRQLVGRTYEVLPFFVLAAIFYMSLNFIIIGIFKILERKARFV